MNIELKAMPQTYKNRHDAGRTLAQNLTACQCDEDTLVLGLPRGGVVVAYEVALLLQIPLDVLIVRKIPAPNQPELAIGAIAAGGARILNDQLIAQYELSEEKIQRIIEVELDQLDRRRTLYMKDRPHPNLKNQHIIIVDDGLATGATMKVAVQTVQTQSPRKITIAIPVAPPETIRQLNPIVDQVICPLQPQNFSAVGQFYQNFTQTTDEEVMKILSSAG